MQAHEYGLKARNVVRLKKEEIRQLENRYVLSEDIDERASLDQEIQRLKKWLDERYKLLSMKVSFCVTPHIAAYLLLYFFSLGPDGSGGWALFLRRMAHNLRPHGA
jgi:hypothetical protein